MASFSVGVYDMQVQWLPGEDVWLAVTSAGSIYIYDLSRKAHAPALTITLPAGASLAGCTFAQALAPVQAKVEQC